MAPQGVTDQLMLSWLLSWAGVAPQGATDLLMLSWLLSWAGWSRISDSLWKHLPFECWLMLGN